ncbi:MAG: hypothetical protein D6820_11680 [Lentisphaerae bacterium]|nr:MAG: hypothetical protein D6820_11680 [Lentisphaerota bacterium]
MKIPLQSDFFNEQVFSDPDRIVCRITPGEVIEAQLPDAMGNLLDDGDPQRGFPALRTGDDPPVGHCLLGPVAVEGARTGQWLKIEVLRLRTTRWAWNWSQYPHHMAGTYCYWEQTEPNRWVCVQNGWTISAQPFLGFAGVAPGRGCFSTLAPHRGGGNIDCPLMTEGSTLYLPLYCDDALFYCGDCHAAQGDGEISGTALECGVRELTLRMSVEPNPPFLPPPASHAPFCLSTASGKWVFFGLGSSLDEAFADAIDNGMALIMAQTGCSQVEARMGLSVHSRIHVTQVVNQTVGIHGIWELL